MNRRTRRAGIIFTGLLISAAAGVAAEKEPVVTLQGDGLIVLVTHWGEEDGTVRGEIRRGEESWPFEGKHIEEAGGAEVVNGFFTAAGEKFKFSSRQETEDLVTFTTDNRTYKLRPVPKALPKPKNPLGGDTPAAPADPRPAEPPRERPPAAANAGQLPETMTLSMHAFPDVNMGAPAAYTVLLPENWKASGNIEWQQVGEQPFPQAKFEIVSPQGGRIRYIPAVTMGYVNAPGVGQQQGEPAPDNFPQWLAGAVVKTNKAVSGVKLVDSKRMEEMERQLAEIDRATHANTQGSKREVWLITLEYDEANVRRREELSIMYVAYQPFQGLNGFVSQNWAFWTNQIVSAPAATFEKDKQALYAVCGTVRSTPGWFTQSQALIREMSQRRAANVWAQIEARGKQINNRLSDAEYKQYKNSINSDSAQRQRINSTYETDDYRDSNGDIVNLPMHYKHVFSDGQGKYVLTNNSLNKPGELWSEITPLK